MPTATYMSPQLLRQYDSRTKESENVRDCQKCTLSTKVRRKRNGREEGDMSSVKANMHFSFSSLQSKQTNKLTIVEKSQSLQKMDVYLFVQLY